MQQTQTINLPLRSLTTMADPITILTASAIANLAFQEFIKSGAGELAKKFTAEAIAKMSDLRKIIIAKLQGKSPKVDEALVKATQGDSTALDTIAKNLDVLMDDEPEFAEELQILGQAIQAGEISQVGLRGVTAGRIKAEIEQTAKGDRVEQIGAEQIKADGDAIFTIKQDIN
ncbi:MAG: hypothetical protein KA717_28385 [Woronichinia naegeliana WA131]|uniref:Uncharacterized protein n=1 Tax=Woronichinia naegeliana WA131 TaxID=2824559 RepID=A0A977KTI9_9CYAN|nr:MAG: hypothetical protein KA717_28385 [Woronichinia naegeliana WA131]